ncbi:hypothetical protein AKJ58_00640 [candidate division MSBL1 archaeon SCGC-AAA385D11]|uniref:Rad50/SbcC-type AAA domain-containing protein n=1 Tax=candidate division MSBL1 archaeon SCGC-AAA385D11 TaxID=1698286 RepID=A0A133VP36_9EURY|nr:hypothetical protein AKJ58_00640 [candidate division MSBL1 archaeon SCGC-AAA385D11]
MKIDQIKLKNYRQYRDVEIRFPLGKEKPTFVVIEGANGAGKTNLLNAITWCLYGKESHIDEKYEGLPLVNMATFSELSPAEDCEVEVEIQMKDEAGKRIIFRRLARFQKSESEMIEQVPASARTTEDTLFEVIRQEDGDMNIMPNPNFTLQRMIPESISQYFFFDGERLNEYFRETPGRTIKSEVHKISQLDLLEKANQHIDRRKNAFLKKFKNLSPEVEDIRKRLEVTKESLENYEKEKEEKELKKRKYEKKEQKYRNKLKASPAEDVGKLEKERENLESELDELEERVKELNRKKFSFLVSRTPLLFSCDAIKATTGEIGERIEAGEIPPDYKKNFLRKLLDKNECICGVDLPEGSERRRRLETLLKETDEISDLSTELIELNSDLKSILSEIQDFGRRQKGLNKNLKELEKRRSRVSKRIKEIDQLISETDVKKVREWETKVQEFKEKKENEISELGQTKFRIKLTEKEIKKLERELEEELKKEDKYRELEKIVSFCNKCLGTIRDIKMEIMEDTRKEIEEKTSEQFFDLIWNPETFKKIAIDGEYNVSVVHKSGYEAMGTLSAGQRQVLALSFMASLNKCSGFDVPIFIDTPLGRISGRPRDNIATNLPNYLEGKQVILLMTDTEYTPRVRERLSSRIGKECKIECTKGEEGSIAEVVPYGK